MRFKCLRALLVVQQERLRRACSGIPFVDGRCSNQGSVSIRLASKRRHADLHFMNLYFREGETMPTCLLSTYDAADEEDGVDLACLRVLHTQQ